MIWPGNYGALRFAKLLQTKKGFESSLTFAEANTLPWGCRLKRQVGAEGGLLKSGKLPGRGGSASQKWGEWLEDLAVICPTASGANVLASSLKT